MWSGVLHFVDAAIDIIARWSPILAAAASVLLALLSVWVRSKSRVTKTVTLNLDLDPNKASQVIEVRPGELGLKGGKAEVRVTRVGESVMIQIAESVPVGETVTIEKNPGLSTTVLEYLGNISVAPQQRPTERKPS